MMVNRSQELVDGNLQRVVTTSMSPVHCIIMIKSGFGTAMLMTWQIPLTEPGLNATWQIPTDLRPLMKFEWKKPQSVTGSFHCTQAWWACVIHDVGRILLVSKTDLSEDVDILTI